MEYNAIFEHTEKGDYVCWIKEMPTIRSKGKTLDQARANLKAALQLSMRHLRDGTGANSYAGSSRSSPGN